MVIIYLGGRPACLIESANYYPTHDFSRDWRTIRRLARNLGLCITRDELALPAYPRYIISKHPLRSAPPDDASLGRLLGMTWTGDFYDYRLPRTSIHIDATTPDGMTLELFSEVVVGSAVVHEQAIRRMCRRWQRLWNETTSLPPLRFQTRSGHDPGTLQRERMLLSDPSYVRAHRSDYLSDIENFCPQSEAPRWLQSAEGRRRLHRMYAERINPSPAGAGSHTDGR